jgi:hypothetical protein
MNKKREALILESVFEQTEAPVGLSPMEETRRREYEQIRLQLQSLKEVPTDQMSKDRLRDAILNRGLGDRKPNPWRARLAYLAAPAASFAFAFVAILAVRANSHSGEPRIVVDNTTVTPMARIQMPVSTAPTPVESASMTQNSQATNVASESSARLVRRLASRRGEGNRQVRKNEDLGMPENTQLVSMTTASGADNVPPPSEEKLIPVTLGTSGETSNGPIVIMQPAESADQPGNATEVSSGAHTLVGG